MADLTPGYSGPAPWWPRPSTWALGLSLLCVLLPFAGASVYHNDEFTYLSLAKRVVEGQALYRDVSWFVPPGSIWALALAFWGLGTSLKVAHAVAAAGIWLAGCQLFRVARRLGVGPWLAWAPAFALALGLYTHWACFSQHWFALNPALAACEAALVGLGGEGALAWAVAGAAAALTGLVLQPDGVAIACALAGAIGLDAWRQRDLPTLARRLGFTGLGLGLVLGLAAALLAWQGGLAEAWRQLVIWPLTRYRQPGGFNDVAFATDLPDALRPVASGPGWYARLYQVLATVALPSLGAAGAAAWLLARGLRRGSPGLALVAVWALASFGALAAGRADYTHTSYYAVPGLLLVTVLAARAWAAAWPLELAWLRALPASALALFILTGALGQALLMRKEPEVWQHPFDPDARLLATSAIQYLRAQARPGDRQASLPFAGFFYFYGPPPASRYTHLMPPELRYGDPAEYEDFWRELATQRPRFVVLAPWAVGATPPLEALAELAARLPAGYHLAAKLESPLYGGPWPTWIYERPAEGP